LDRELLRITGVLVMASPAPLKVRTLRLDPFRGSLHNAASPCAREARLLLLNRSLDFLSGKGKGHKHRFPASLLVRRQAGQSVPAINQLFNGEFQAPILFQGHVGPAIVVWAAGREPGWGCLGTDQLPNRQTTHEFIPFPRDLAD